MREKQDYRRKKKFLSTFFYKSHYNISLQEKKIIAIGEKTNIWVIYIGNNERTFLWCLKSIKLIVIKYLIMAIEPEESVLQKVFIFPFFWLSYHLQLPLSISNTLYLELKSRSLCVGCNLFFSLYLKLSLSRTNSLVPCEFERERVNCIYI